MIRSMSLGILAFGTLVAFGEPPQEKKAIEPAKPAFLTREPPKGSGRETELRKLQIERYKVAQEILYWQFKAIEQKSYAFIDPALAMGPKMLAAYLDLEPTKEERLAIMKDYFNFTRELEETLKKHYEVGTLKKQQFLNATQTRLEAEIMVMKELGAK